MAKTINTYFPDTLRHDEIKSKSPLWEKALENYREELSGNDYYETILENGTLEELIDHTKTLEPSSPSDKTSSTMSRIKPIVKFFNDFSTIVAICFGADTVLAAVVWGSIRVLLTLASNTGDALRDILDMLEELALTLPRFKAYEESLPMNTALESSLLAVYTEVICFYARAIHTLRQHPHIIRRQSLWADFHGDFSRTIQRIKRLSSTVEREADLARMRLEKDKYHEVLELMATYKEKSPPDYTDTKSCHYLPYAVNSRFGGRQEVLEEIDKALDPSLNEASLRSFALYGMGGVGKTQAALKYAEIRRDKFDSILWVAADSLITMGQSFREIARHLGLLETEIDQETEDNIVVRKVKNWLSDTRCNWLLIFDNADDLDVLKHAWPKNAEGSILLTTRDFNSAFQPALGGYHIKPFDDTTGSTALLNILGLDKDESNVNEAKAIVSTLGGLPLAVSQIAGFISQRKMPLQGFLPLYERNAPKIDSRKTKASDHDLTLSTIWEMSITKLSGDSRMLQMLLAFFDPDRIHESILCEGSQFVRDLDFTFLNDEIDLVDAEEVLLKTALVDKTGEDGTLSLHRLVQRAVMRRMSTEERIKAFEAAVDILGWGFPDTYSADIGHQISGWERCEKCLPHIDHIVKQTRAYNVNSRDPQVFAELLLRCCWYLYEKEYYTNSKAYIQVALENFTDKSTLAYASALELSGLIELDISCPRAALDMFKKSFQIREKILDPADPFFAASLVTFGLACTEMGELEDAHSYLQRSIDIRLEANSDRIGNSYSNMSSLLLRMVKPDEAEEILKRCPSLKDFTDETFMKTGNPRFSGDMVLLSRIRLAQGRLDEAIHLASKALSFRQSLLGSRIKICDSLYQVADLLHKQGNIASAIQLLSECVAISEILPESEGQRHLAQAKYKLSILFNISQKEKESIECRQQALDLKAKLHTADAVLPIEEGVTTEQEIFERLTPWMLW